MHDAHVHLDFMTNGEQVASGARDAGIGLFANTVTPDGYDAARARFAPYETVAVGLGLHPWWVQDAGDAEAVVQRIGTTRFIGEIGLDFGKRHIGTRADQAAAFTRITSACAEAGGKVISIHSVHAARDVLDILEATGASESCACLFHWFSGPSDQLKRAIEAGCYFSVGMRSLATGKGREYAKVIPVDRLLVETDEPAERDTETPFEALLDKLGTTVRAIEEIKGEGAARIMDDTFHRLFDTR